MPGLNSGVTILTPRLWFPDPRHARKDGLVAVGGDLSVERLLLAYRQGIFPWSVSPLSWWSPDPRGIFELDQFHTSRSLTKLIRQAPYEVTANRAFRQVIEGCARPARGRRSTWISPEFVEAYTQLHSEGHAQSIECWQDQELVGGIYGVTAGGLFAGESMFHRANNASKIALYHLIDHLNQRQFSLFDIQMVTPITASLGARSIRRTEYLERLSRALEKNCTF